ncbi:glycosyltransferase family 2 protein [Pseudotamlana agarivorans]|uniref:glycosyltransferase family 2 protein n=1 Tax=Pseudotamlana agarivorans TaxID=481183 RepID=UPI00082D8A48|nr:glycosyltransferase family 2 protein [Tamlana agarivorans]
MSEPLISIIIPTFNRAHLIRGTLDSVLAQTYTNWECLVVDDGSTDGTDAIMAEYCAKDARFQYYHRPKDRLPGGNAARNYGFEVSKGEYVNWFDDDDIMLPEFISKKIYAFERIKTLQLVICSGSFADSSLKNHNVIDLKITSYLYKDYSQWNLKVLTPSVLFKKDFLANKDLFKTEILRGQETEFLSRLFFELPKEQYFIINSSLFLYRQHEATKTSKNKTYVPEFKNSLALNCITNFKRVLILRDSELINHFYVETIGYFFLALKNGDIKTSKHVFSELSKLLFKLKSKMFLEFLLIGGIFIGIRRGSFKIEKRWMRLKI